MSLQFFLLMLSWSLSGFAHQRPKCNLCDENLFCNCSHSNFQQVPVISIQSVRNLDLSFNDIKLINHDDFVSYTDLQVLILGSNSISEVAEQAFSALGKLQVLDLSYNQLSVLSEEWFLNLLSLAYLNLLGNKYEAFGEGRVLRPLTSLRTLLIGSESLSSIHKESFVGLPHLHRFVFHGSNLQSYQPGSFSEILTIDEATVSINGPFETNSTLATEIMRDLSRPKTRLIVADLKVDGKDLEPLQVISQQGVEDFFLRNLSSSTDSISYTFSILNQSPLISFGIEDCEFNGQPTLIHFPLLNRLRNIYINNIRFEKFYQFPAFHGYIEVGWLLIHLRRLTLVDSHVFAMPHETTVLLFKLQFLDLSRNQLTDLTLHEAICRGQGGTCLPALETLNISSNYIRDFHTLSHLFRDMTKLEALDVSLNGFRTMPLTCAWPPSLHFLNVSSCHLRVVTTCLPQTLLVLDLSFNDLEVFQLAMSNLTELYLLGNRLKTLPDGRLLLHLQVLYISKNPLISFTHRQLKNYGNLQSLEAGTDTYVCACEFVSYFQQGLTKSVQLTDRKGSYVCNSPFALRGTQVMSARLSVFHCHAPLAYSILCAIVLLLLVVCMVVCHKFHVVWYLQMMWAWVQAKRRPAARLDQMCYDAFVSYSEKDSEWVETLLVPEMEEAQPPVQLCLHKRHFLPGGWIADNIMAAMEKSHKTLFIVTQHFVQSDWCRFELEYSHFRLFESSILVLLEPIPDSTIPKRLCRLRKVMNSRTYLEWPEEENERPRFWQTLKDALKM